MINMLSKDLILFLEDVYMEWKLQKLLLNIVINFLKNIKILENILESLLWMDMKAQKKLLNMLIDIYIKLLIFFK